MNDDCKFTIRPATFQDALSVFRLIKENSANLMLRSLGDIVQNIDRFLVTVDADGVVFGAIAYEILPEIGDPSRTTIELQSVCVSVSHRRHGIGRKMVITQLRRIYELMPVQVIVLTFTPEFFSDLGFHKVEKASLMHKIYTGCINCSKHESPFTCPEVAMALDFGDIAAVIGC